MKCAFCQADMLETQLFAVLGFRVCRHCLQEIVLTHLRQSRGVRPGWRQDDGWGE